MGGERAASRSERTQQPGPVVTGSLLTVKPADGDAMSDKGGAMVTVASSGLGAAFSGALPVRRYAVRAVGCAAAPAG